MTTQKTISAVETVFAYHDRTKHDFHRSARSPGYLDWANQPNPFRRYANAPAFLLPLSDRDLTPPYESLYGHETACQPLNIESLSLFLENALGISASKSYQGAGWKLRCNPSSGNLHPTEGYVIVPPLEDLSEDPGVYHYAPNEHTLEQRCVFPRETWPALMDGLPEGTFLAALTSIQWREAWKYGERAYRYCNHDTGHALAAYAYSAAALGWTCLLLDELGDEAVGAILGVDRAGDYVSNEPEYPELVVAVLPGRSAPHVPTSLPSSGIEGVAQGTWRGTANRLSPDHVEWEIIDHVTEACIKPATSAQSIAVASHGSIEHEYGHDCSASAREIIQQRRSAVAMDGVTSISRQSFFTMLERTLPAAGRFPWDTCRWPASIHLGLFVHRVDDFPPGLYFLLRDLTAQPRLQEAMNDNFAWKRADGCADELPLFELARGDYRGTATQLSCGQEIAGDGAFSLAMIADFEGAIARHGAWYYPRLFWEAGRVGQVLYLEAEAAGVRSTGIGCYFDDPVHDLFGLTGRAFQSLYHFTVGGAVDDARLTSEPPYTPERRAVSGWV
ncbi:MAG: SagB/ThcOx family dehydrogenase [Candidatus Hydrogenedentes bacterium]|nr:SagB/ThcOx family dehydrogenase [Candidatus Hydrogenedentota bacterium]